MAEVIIPPWVRPESPETLRWIDDATSVFPPAFGRGMTQRGIWADPRWGMRRRYRGLRSDQKAAILACLNESRGQLNKILVTPHTPLRGNFPATELLNNPTFASGTTGWTSSSNVGLSVSDRLLRSSFSATAATTLLLQQTPTTVVAYAPYVCRAFVSPSRAGNGAYDASPASLVTVANGTGGMITRAYVPVSTSDDFRVQEISGTGRLAGDYVSIPFTSLARCALADSGRNDAVYSDQIDNIAGWSYTAVTVGAGIVSPDGSTTAVSISETTANSTHSAQQDILCSSSAIDFCFAVAVKAGTRSFCQLSMGDYPTLTEASAYFNLSAVSVGTIATGANWSNVRAFIVDLGNSWRYCCVVGRKTSSNVFIRASIRAATANGTNSYTGSAASPAINAWRATGLPSSVPSRLVQTTSPAATTGSPLSGGGMYLKGLPASTTGLMEIGDWAEVAGQLKQTTAQLNSDAAGLGYWQFRPTLATAPDDSEPVIINQPFGRFIYPGGQKELENLFGIYADCEMNLEEIYS